MEAMLRRQFEALDQAYGAARRRRQELQRALEAAEAAEEAVGAQRGAAWQRLGAARRSGRDFAGLMREVEARLALGALCEEGAVVRHRGRGSEYVVVGLAALQSAQAVGEGACLVVYQGDDGGLWARPEGEFGDGRFELVEVYRRRAAGEEHEEPHTGPLPEVEGEGKGPLPEVAGVVAAATAARRAGS